jgi:hypothetical protein
MRCVAQAFLLRCKAEHDFWKDSDTFLSILKRQYIDDRKLLTYRKVRCAVLRYASLLSLCLHCTNECGLVWCGMMRAAFVRDSGLDAHVQHQRT